MYVLDTNVFIDAANAYYAFDLAPGYWDFLVQLFDSHHAVSIKSVYDELDDASDDDPLKAWVKQNRQHFLAPDSRVVSCYQRVSAWAIGNHQQSAVNEFLEGRGLLDRSACAGQSMGGRHSRKICTDIEETNQDSRRMRCMWGGVSQSF